MYVVDLSQDVIDERVRELQELGRPQGGSAHGFVTHLITTSLLDADSHSSSFKCDVSSKENIEKLAACISEREDHVDILVSNAGIRRDPVIACNVLTAPLKELQASMWSSKHSDWADTFCINTTAHYFMSVAFLPLLAAASQMSTNGERQGRGVVVLTSSCASMHNATNIDLTSYASSKAATDHLVKLLAAKFSRFYVRVASINPGCKCNSKKALRIFLEGTSGV